MATSDRGAAPLLTLPPAATPACRRRSRTLLPLPGRRHHARHHPVPRCCTLRAARRRSTAARAAAADGGSGGGGGGHSGSRWFGPAQGLDPHAVHREWQPLSELPAAHCVCHLQADTADAWRRAARGVHSVSLGEGVGRAAWLAGLPPCMSAPSWCLASIGALPSLQAADAIPPTCLPQLRHIPPHIPPAAAVQHPAPHQAGPLGHDG